MAEANNTIIVFGCGGHSRSVTDILLLNDPHAMLIFVDDCARENEKLFGFDVVKEYPVGTNQLFFAIGNNDKRRQKYEEVCTSNLISVVSRFAHVGYGARIGSGCFVGNFCHIGPEAVVGNNTILNTAAIIEHEVKIGSHCHVGPNATISGRCTIGDLVFVGVGATVKDYVTICSDVIVGAGATVVKDITEPGTYVGTPARRIK